MKVACFCGETYEADRPDAICPQCSGRSTLYPKCAHCRKEVMPPDTYWHEWLGYVHRGCWIKEYER